MEQCCSGSLIGNIIYELLRLVGLGMGIVLILGATQQVSRLQQVPLLSIHHDLSR